MTSRDHGPNRNEWLRERAIQMRADGAPWASIRRELGISQGRLQSFLKGNRCRDCGANITVKAMRCHRCRALLAVPTWTKDDVRNAVARFFVSHGRPPTAREWNRPAPGRPATHDVINRFGSFNAAIQYAGLTPRRSGQQVSHAGGHRKYRPSVANGDSRDEELAFLIKEQERDARFGHRAQFTSLDGNDWRGWASYTDAWTWLVCAILDRRAEIDAWAEELVA